MPLDLQQKSIGSFKGLKPSQHVNSILDFLNTHLPEFVLLYRQRYSLISNEIGITQKLEMYLNPLLKKELSTFNLSKEYVEDTSTGQSPKSDLGFYLDGDDMAFFCIEAKRLPAPGSGRKREYVYSKSGKEGGIERFKKEIHGKGLRHSAIIGYVQKNTPLYWKDQINKWIQDCIKNGFHSIVWNKDDELSKIKMFENFLRCQSLNKRESDSITLYHYLINLTIPRRS